MPQGPDCDDAGRVPHCEGRPRERDGGGEGAPPSPGGAADGARGRCGRRRDAHGCWGAPWTDHRPRERVRAWHIRSGIGHLSTGLPGSGRRCTALSHGWTQAHESLFAAEQVCHSSLLLQGGRGCLRHRVAGRAAGWARDVGRRPVQCQLGRGGTAQGTPGPDSEAGGPGSRCAGAGVSGW